MSTTAFGPISWNRIMNGVEEIYDRLRRAVAGLEAANIPYAVVGGNAVAAWVSRIDKGGMRFTQDVDIALRRDDLDAAKQALAGLGFIYRHVKGIDMFLDGPGSKARDAVHILLAGEKVRPDDLATAVSTAETELVDTDWGGAFRVASLEALVRMKLTSYRLKDQVHLQDMVQVGLLDDSWPARYIPELGERLQRILDNPEA